MKNTITSFIIFAIMLGAMFFSLNYLNRVYSTFRAESNQLEELIRNESWEKAVTSSNGMLDRWKEQSKIIPMFVNHAEVDNMTNELLKLTQYVENHTKDEALASTHVIKFWLDNIKTLQKITIENIF